MRTLFESLLDIDSIETDINVLRHLSTKEFRDLYRKRIKSIDAEKNNPICIMGEYDPLWGLCEGFMAKNIDVGGLYPELKTKTMHDFAMNCKNLIEFQGPDPHINYSEIESLEWFFRSDTKLKSFDLSGIAKSARNIKNIAYMFSLCASIEYIDLSNFKFSNMISLNNAFNKCTSLRRIDLGDSDSLAIALFMCQEDKNLEEFNAPNMILSGVDIFSGCESLRHINVRYIDVSDRYYDIFDQCIKLESVNIFGLGKNTMHDFDYIDLSWAVSLNDKSWKFLFGNMRDADNIIIKLPNTPKKKKIIEKNSIIIKKHNLKLI